MNKRSTTRFELDTDRPPALTPEQRKRLDKLAAMPESQIDHSDIPLHASPVRWTHPDALAPAANKQQVTLRLDSDVLEFFKETGARYQTRINAVLREYMQAHRAVEAPGFAAWLREEVILAAHALKADPSHALSAVQARDQLKAKRRDSTDPDKA